MTPKPWRSGHCNASNPPKIHEQCKGFTTRKGEQLDCTCECHWQPEPLGHAAAEPRLGVWDDLDEDAYHSDPTSISASGMKDILRSPAHFQHARKHPKSSAAMDTGSIAHKLVLGKGGEFVVIEGNRNRNDVKDAIAEAEAEGKTVLKPEQMAAANRIADAVLTDPKASMLFAAPGRSELSMFWRDPAFGVIRRCRWDRLTDTGIGIDLKTTKSSDPLALPKTIVEYRYDLSAAWYLAVAAGLDIEISAYALVFVESTEPHPVTVVELHNDFLERGAALAHKALTTYRRSVDTDTWPGYADDFLTLAPPRWAETAEQISLTIPEGTSAA